MQAFRRKTEITPRRMQRLRSRPQRTTQYPAKHEMRRHFRSLVRP